MRPSRAATVSVTHLLNPLLVAYCCGDLATFVKLTFFDGYSYNWWNWLVAVPANLLLSAIWPFYWTVIRPELVGS